MQRHKKKKLNTGKLNFTCINKKLQLEGLQLWIEFQECQKNNKISQISCFNKVSFSRWGNERERGGDGSELLTKLFGLSMVDLAVHWEGMWVVLGRGGGLNCLLGLSVVNPAIQWHAGPEFLLTPDRVREEMVQGGGLGLDSAPG